MTQPGSFPDRPRGRRARHASDTPEWQGQDAVPPDEREFPDLPPVRDRRLSDADNRGLPGGHGGRGRHSAQSGPAGGPSWPGDERQFGGSQGPYEGQAQYGPEAQFDQQYGQPDRREHGGGQFGAEQFGTGPQAQYPPAPGGGRPPVGPPGVAGGGRPPVGPAGLGGGLSPAPTWSPRTPGPGEAPQPVPARHGRSRGEQPRQAATSWEQDDSEVSDDPMEAFSRRWARRGAETPEDAHRRKRLWFVGGSTVGAIIVGVAVLLYFTVFTGRSSGNVSFGSLVTTFLPGEIQTVPNACNSVSAATLSQYLPGGQPSIAAPPLNGGTDSSCTWTLDHAPNYRVIEVDITAFSPSGLASGDGSATFAAIDAYTSDQSELEKPAASSDQPPATTQEISGLGTQAFSATQIFNVSGATTYKATVIVRYRNVIVRAFVNGFDKAVTSEGSYGPVSMSTLVAAAQQVATEGVGQLTH